MVEKFPISESAELEGEVYYCIIELGAVARFTDLSDSYSTSDLVFDSPTVVMLSVVTSRSNFVHLSILCMLRDPYSPLIMCYLSIPTFYVPMLVTVDKSLKLFLGWEGTVLLHIH